MLKRILTAAVLLLLLVLPAAFFKAGTGLIAPLGQYIHANEKDLSY